MAWVFLGVSNEVAVATTAHALVTTGISGTLAADDLLVACITSRIASTTSIVLPGATEVFSQPPGSLVSTGAIGNSVTTERRSQSFTPSSSCLIFTADVWLSKQGTPTDNILLDIYLTDGVGRPIGSSLATSITTIAASGLTNSAALCTFTFTPPPAVAGSVQYALVLRRSGAADAANRCLIHGDSAQAISTEFMASYNTTTGVWTTTTSFDCAMSIKANGWTLVAEQKNNNILTTSSALPSGLMAYCVRGASNPNLTFTHPVAPSQAQGRIVAYRNVNTASPKDTQTSFTTATAQTAVTGTGLTTTQIEDLIVAMAAGGQEAAWSAFRATDPAGASGATVTTAPTTTWSERADSAVTTGADGSLAIFDAVKLTSGATGNLTATASVSAGHVVIAGAFKLAAPSDVTGTGTPAGQAGDADGAGISSSEGSGAPAGQASAVSGTGTAGDAAATGSGAIAADAAVVNGAGISDSVATGALAAQSAMAAGAGISASSGSGAMAAQAATASGAGAVASVGIGALAAQAATAAGSGLSVATGTGALQADAATVAGAGASVSAGTGSIVAGSAEVAGTGTAAAGDSGALVAQAATVAGLGASGSIGSGALQADAAIVAGAGLGDSFGTGTLLAGAATITAEGVVLEEGAEVGSGALVAGEATIAGEGEVTGEVVIPPIYGGDWWPWRQQPVAVEGVGYAILPEIEGEAHGVVLAVGAGAAFLPASNVGTAAVGAIGVIARGTARLSLKAAAVGEPGQAGAARAVLRGLSCTSAGVTIARGSGSGAIIGLRAAALGRHDDDEAAILALLAA